MSQTYFFKEIYSVIVIIPLMGSVMVRPVMVSDVHKVSSITMLKLENILNIHKLRGFLLMLFSYKISGLVGSLERKTKNIIIPQKQTE
jgi:hypothetical protein